MSKLIRLCWTEAEEVIYQGKVYNPPEDSECVHPLYVVAYIPRRIDAIKRDEWTVRVGAESLMLTKAEAAIGELCNRPGPQQPTAVVIVCVTHLDAPATGILHWGGSVWDAQAAPWYTHVSPGVPVLTGGAELYKAVRDYLSCLYREENPPAPAVIDASGPQQPTAADDTAVLGDSKRCHGSEHDAS